MGSDTIPLRSNGQAIDQTWYNVIRNVFMQDQFPRNTSGVATDQAGSLGSDSLRWLNAYLIRAYLFNGSRSINLRAPSGMASDYSLTLPDAPPASGSKILFIDSTGQATVEVEEDNSSLEVDGTTLQVKDGGITRAKLAAMGESLTASCGTFSFTSEAAITNFSVTKTVSGRPVLLSVISDGSGNEAYLDAASTINFRWKQDGTAITRTAAQGSGNLPVSIFDHVYTPAAGTYTWTATLVSVGTGSLNYAKMFVVEL